MPIKWYVNLETNYGEKEKPVAGRAIPLVATRKFGHNRGRTGTAEVDWTLVGGGAHPEDLDYVPVADRGRFDADRTGEQANGQFLNTLRAPWMGGRILTVTAAKHGGTANVAFSKEYETWRRIYYTLHYMDNPCKELFKSVEAQIKAAFAAVHIELKPRGVHATLIDEPVTDRGNDPAAWVLPRTYTAGLLDRGPHHLRVVLVRNLANSSGFDAHWTMTAATVDDPTKLIGISSQGPNHSQVVYRNRIAAIDVGAPVINLSVHVHTPSVLVPNPCIARDNLHQVTVNLAADPATTAIGDALNGVFKANLDAHLTGHRCAAGFAAGNDHPIQAPVNLTSLVAAPVVVGSARVWTTDAGGFAVIQDPNIVLANPGPADQLRITLASTVVVALLDTDIARVDDHTLRLDLRNNALVVADLAANRTIGISVRRHGALGLGPVQASANYEFDLREFAKNKQATRRKVRIAVHADGRSMVISAPWLALSTAAPLTMRLDTLEAAIVVPPAAISRPTPQQLQVDLTLGGMPAAVAAAMAGNGKLTFDGRLRGLHSIGGYSPNTARNFVALTAIRLSDGEANTVTARRIMLAFCHELGHALGLVHTRSRNHTHPPRWDANDLHYEDEYGGHGEHCKFNAELQPSGAQHGRKTTTSGEIYEHTGVGSLCIMFHDLEPARMGDHFCASCQAHLRRAKVQL